MNVGVHNVILKYIKEKIVSKPIFLMLVGISGSGKSSVADKIKMHVSTDDEIQVLSSDNLRAELLGDVNDQSQNARIFGTMHKRTIDLLKNGCSVIYDATNLTIKDRGVILKLIENEKIDCCKIAYIISTPYAIALVNNMKRERVVPAEVIKKQLHKFQIPIYQEGFNFIFVEGYDYENFTYQKDKLNNVPMSLRGYVIFDLMKNFEQGTHYHKFSLMEHSILTYEEILRYKRKNDKIDRALEQAALLHDIGKLNTKTLNDKGEFSYYGHANVGAYRLLQNLDWLGLECFEQALYCVALINYHMDTFGWEDAKPLTKTKKELFFKEKMYNDLMLLHKADKYASTGEREN